MEAVGRFPPSEPVEKSGPYCLHSAFCFLPSLGSFLLHPFPLLPPPLRPPEADFRDLTQLPFSHQQELVNLLLTGRAVSNVFNDIVELDSGDGNITLLRGIEARSDIGFLSLFEHYNVCQVPMCTLGPQQPSSLDP